MNTQIIEILYLIAATIAVGACIPQLRQLVIAKASDELSLPTWITWTLTQCFTLMYVISIKNIPMTIVNVIWVSFYASMVGLIVYYRRASNRRPEVDVACYNLCVLGNDKKQDGLTTKLLPRRA